MNVIQKIQNCKLLHLRIISIEIKIPKLNFAKTTTNFHKRKFEFDQIEEDKEKKLEEGEDKEFNKMEIMLTEKNPYMKKVFYFYKNRKKK